MVLSPDDFSQLHLYAVLDDLPAGVMLADAEGRIVFCNEAGNKILGAGVPADPSPDSWTGHYGIFEPDGETPFPTEGYPLYRALSGERARDVEMFIRNAGHPDGAYISVSGRPLLDEAGAITGAAVVFRDITALRRTERLKEELTTFIVHDLKNPLASILTTCELLALSTIEGEARADVVTIREAAERMRRMVLDLLDVQMAEDGALRLDLEPVSLQTLLGEVATAAKRRLQGRSQRIAVVDPGPLTVSGDHPHLFRVLTNFVDNCAKYGPEGGTVTIDVVPADGGRLTIRVSDEGPGVPPELRERIFEKYAQAERGPEMRSKESRGLGLRFCHVVVEALGGRIWVEDAEPCGARFCVELPSVTAAA
ncbi:MAG: ATP-binding protein [Gemmatimonadota bacterium]